MLPQGTVPGLSCRRFEDHHLLQICFITANLIGNEPEG